MTDTAVEQAAPEAPQPEIPVAEQREAPQLPAELFRYSAWIHVGPGAEGCDDIDETAGTNSCENPLHFHGWARLPNQFQHREIREKAMAAKARRIRAMRDEETDSYAILEADMDVLRTASVEVLVEELVGKNWWRNFMEASQDAREKEEFEHIERDQERWNELDGQSEDDRPAEEFEELTRQLEKYAKAVEDRRTEIEQPERDSLLAREVDDLVGMIRDDRIAAAGQAEFMSVYSSEQWFLGTLVQPGGERRFDSRDRMRDSAPEVVDALQATYDDLENALNRGDSGNS